MVVQAVVIGTARATTVAAKTGVKAGQTAVKAGRAASRSTRAGAQAASRAGHGARSISRPMRRNNRKNSVQQGRSNSQTLQNHPLYKAGRKYAKVRHKIKQTTNTMKGLTLSSFLLGFYLMQLTLAFISLISFKVMAGTGFWAWFGENVYGAKTIAAGIYWVSWAAYAGLGTGLLFVTAIVCIFVYRLQVFRHSSVLFMFSISLWGYWAPFFMLMFFPWAVIWLWATIFAQK
tara:strand:- start:1100 stop:1795 length:696 start_codon:yes stop_codon:yes gene_type:complete